MAAQPTRVISKAKLLALVKASEACSSRMAEERQALGTKFESATTSDNFNPKALRVLMPLLRMDPGPQAHLWRTILLYAEHLDIGTQADLEDIANARPNSQASGGEGGGGDDDAEGEGGGGDDDAEGEGEGGEDDGGIEAQSLADAMVGALNQADAVDSVLDGVSSTPELARFKAALQDATTSEAVNKGLEAFTFDHPTMSDEAIAMAQDRLMQLHPVTGDEPANSNAPAEEAAAPAETAPKKRVSKPRPKSPAAEAARSIGIGSEFGQPLSGKPH
jgi:hypothetical protein